MYESVLDAVVSLSLGLGLMAGVILSMIAFWFFKEIEKEKAARRKRVIARLCPSCRSKMAKDKRW